MFFADLTDQWCGCTLAHRKFAAELSCCSATCRCRPEDNLPACLGRRASCPSNRDRLYRVCDKKVWQEAQQAEKPVCRDSQDGCLPARRGYVAHVSFLNG